MKINQIKSFISHTLVRKAKPVLPQNKKYYLIEKLENMPIKKFPRDSWAIPQNAVTFKQVKIGKTKDPEYRRNIISFYDKENKIIRQFQSGTDNSSAPGRCPHPAFPASAWRSSKVPRY